ncbi:MAG: hypothetical protein P8176_07845 [Gammaproteobacteria bacterium]
MSKKRANALQSLAAEMNVQTSERTNVDDSNHQEIQQDVSTSDSSTKSVMKKPKSRVVNNIPWYPKSKRLKQELKLLALHEETTLTGLIDEGIAMVLEKRGKNINDYL